MNKSFIGSGLLLACTLSLAAPVDDARSLLQQGKPAAAAELLDATLVQHLTHVEHNYLLGIAMLDSGRAGNAVFAFERVLALQPDHAMARAELARAMIELREYDAARAELMQVRQAPIPAEVAVKVDTLLAALDRAINERALVSGAAVISGYVEGELGYDSNINTATSSNSVVIPLFGLPALLTGYSRAQSSWLLGVNGGLAVQKRVADGVDLYGGVDVRLRYHPSNEDYLPAAIAVGGGARLTRGDDQFGVGMNYLTYYIGQYRNDAQLGLYGQWQHQIDARNATAVFVQHVWAEHPIAPALDSRLTLLGGNWIHALQRTGNPRLTLTGWIANDREQGQDPGVGRTFAGLKLGAEMQPADAWKLFGSLAVQKSRYGGQNLFFGVTRQDERYDLNLGVSYKPAPNWTYSAQLTHTRNQSNIAINHFTRDLLLFTARRDF